MNSYLLYPKVFLEFAQSEAKHSDLSVLPTTVFFYGMETGEEVSVEIEPGPSVLTTVFRARTESGPRCYLFDGDGDTPPYEWRTSLREICWQSGCWDPVVPSASSTPGARSCARHVARPLTAHPDPA